MTDGTFILMLNERLEPDERLFKLSSAELTKGSLLTVTLIMKAADYDAYISPKGKFYETKNLKNKVETAVREVIRETTNGSLENVSIVYKKTSTDIERVKLEALNFFKNDRKLLAPKITASDMTVEISPDKFISIEIEVSEAIFAFCRDNKVADALKNKLDTLFMEDTEITFKIGKDEPIIPPPDYKGASAIRSVHYENPVKLYGNITASARYISDILELKREVGKVCVTGTITMLKKLCKKSDQSSKFYVFRLDDKSGMVDVKFFPNNPTAAGAGELLEEGISLVVEGPFRYDKFSESFTITAYSLARIEVDYNSQENARKFKDAPENYSTVFPAPYVEEETYNVSIYDTEDTYKPAEYLMGKTIVVFDTETTGLMHENDEIIEIGAVKMVDGQLTETFSTLIKPTNNIISSKITDLTGIDDAMVKNSPTFDDIAGDFKKFVEGAVLVAYNSPFDMGMILPQMRRADYDLTNPVVDALQLAKENVPLHKHNLETVAAALDVSLEGAHRAVNDAVATAKVFKKLAYKLKK